MKLLIAEQILFVTTSGIVYSAENMHTDQGVIQIRTSPWYKTLPCLHGKFFARPRQQIDDKL